MEHKHHPASKGSRAKSGGSAWTGLFIVLSIILIAAIIVFSPLGEMIFGESFTEIISCSSISREDKEIVSALKNQDSELPQPTLSPKPEEKLHDVVSVEEVPFYILQMGAFTAKDSAEQHAEEINRLGAGGVVFAEGSVYRVFAAAYRDEESLAKVQAQVRNDGFEATPYITDQKLIKLTLDGDKEAVELMKEIVRIISDIPNKLCGLSLSFDKGEIDLAGIKSSLIEIQDDCKKFIAELEKMDKTSIRSISDLLKKYQEKISTFLQDHDTIDETMMIGSLKRLQLSVIIDYILFFNQE